MRLIYIYKLYYIELLHRYIFDNIYLHSESTNNTWGRGVDPYSKKEKFIIKIYNLLLIKVPNWRYEIKQKKLLLNRAYKQKRMHFKYFTLLNKLNKRNYNRYK